MKFKGMKKIYVMFLVLGLVFSGKNVTVTNAKKVVTHKFSKIIVAVGTKYKISQIAKDTGNADTGVTLSKMIKKEKVKWSSKNKNLKITGNSFKAKKTGIYQLTGTAKKKKIIVTLEVVGKNAKEDLSKVAYMTIRSGNDGSSVKIENYESVQNLCTMINTAKFTFDYKLANKGRQKGWSYVIKLYSSNGEEQYTMTNSKPAYYYTSKQCDAIHEYTERLFKSAKEQQNIAG